MYRSADSSALRSSGSSEAQYLSIGQAATLLGCSVGSLRNYEKSERVIACRTCGGSKFGQRRYLGSELLAECLGVETGTPVDEQENGKAVCIHSRVSSAAQR
jgi:hypothetical protein